MIIYAPVQSQSGYGANARDKVKAIYDLYNDTYDIKVFPCRWGSLPMDFIENNTEWEWLDGIMIDKIDYKPNVWVMITVPNEMQPVGDYNILITAGMETDLISGQWVEGLNRANLVIVPSEHSKQSILNSKYEIVDHETHQRKGDLKCNTEVVVIPEGANLNVYTKLLDVKNLNVNLDYITEDFVYLFTGAWLPGSFNEDRKNVGLLIKAFCEVFKNKKNKPALLLKTHIGSTSYMDRREILRRINDIKNSCDTKDLPNIYLLHGDLTDSEMNELYNNPKIKAMISLTKGEGFGRPLLEFSLCGKPVIASNWSGHVDFLNKEFTFLVNGELKNVDQSAVIENMIIPESKWFNPNSMDVARNLMEVFNNYKDAEVKGKRQAYYAKTNFNYDVMKSKIKELLDVKVPKFAKKVEFTLPKLNEAKLPTLK